jgi:RNA polymerase sigma-54 factor
MAALLDNLDLLARRDMNGLRRICGVDDEDLREMVAEIRALNPRPGAASRPSRPRPWCPTSMSARASAGCGMSS